MIVCAHAGAVPLADETVQCVVTSPPYWGLRKYAGEQTVPGWGCAFGLEPTIQLYVTHTVEILREVRRVLRSDGVCFWTIGDSYCGYWGDKKALEEGRKSAADGHGFSMNSRPKFDSFRHEGVKPKDLCLIPSRVALAAQEDGWWVRSMIIWAKPNPMPESVQDRPTDAYEHILMLTKSERYYWDADAVRESSDPVNIRKDKLRGPKNAALKENGQFSDASFSTGFNGFRNIRNVWTLPTQPYSGAHFATFPEEIPRRCIKAASKVGDLVLDPFGGSGTTGRVAIELRRRPVLLDLAYAHDYAPLAKERTRNVQLEAFA